MLNLLNSVGTTPRMPISLLSALPLPAIFPWQPDFKVFNTDGVYSSNYNPAADKPSGTAIWVATNGDDTSGDGSEAAPYRSIARALQDGTILHIRSGFYGDTHGAFGMGVGQDTALIAVDGAGSVILSSNAEDLSWSQSAAPQDNVYGAFVSLGVNDVVDLSYTRAGEFLKGGSAGLPIPYSAQSSIADVQANAGSFYYNGGTLYVHTHDGRAPDGDIKPLWNKSIWTTSNVQHSLYLEGIEFWGADALLMNGHTNIATSKIVAVDCAFRFENTEGNARCVSIKDTRFVRCAVSDCGEDGFSYANNSSSFEQTVLEIDCTAHRCGRVAGGDDNNNCSTAHKNCSVIRINGIYDTSQGPIVADITGAHALCFNVNARNSDSDRGDGHRTDSSFSTGSFGANNRVTRMWLYDCRASGSGYDRAISTGGLILSDDRFIGDAGRDNGIILRLEQDSIPASHDDLTLWFDFDHDITVEAGGSGIIEMNDKSPQRSNARQNVSSRRLPSPAVIAGVYNDRKVTSPDDRLADSSLEMLSDITIGDLYIVCSFKDGLDTTFDNFETLVSGPGSSGTPRILGLTGSGNISDSIHALSDVSINGEVSGFNAILPLPFSVLRMTPDTPRNAVYTFFRHSLSSARGWPGDIAEIIAFETAKSADEDAAIRGYLSEKWDV